MVTSSTLTLCVCVCVCVCACVCVCVCCTWYFLDDHLAEVTGDVRQQVSLRVADLVHQLLGHRAEGDEAAGFGRFGENEGAVARTLDHREPHVVPESQREREREVSASRDTEDEVKTQKTWRLTS